MLNFLYRWFSKDYAVAVLEKEYVFKELIIPYDVVKYNCTIKGNVYVRKTKHVLSYNSLFLSNDVKILYSGIFHAIYQYTDGNKEEKTIQLKPDYYRNDGEFLLKSVDTLT